VARPVRHHAHRLQSVDPERKEEDREGGMSGGRGQTGGFSSISKFGMRGLGRVCACMALVGVLIKS
jgi:hypothetical protein